MKVRRDDVEVRYRGQYRDESHDQRSEELSLASLELGFAENPLVLEVVLGEPENQRSGHFVLPLEVSFPIASLVLLPDRKTHNGKIAVRVAARDQKGRLSEPVTDQVPIEIPHAGMLQALTAGRRASPQSCQARHLSRPAAGRVPTPRAGAGAALAALRPTPGAAHCRAGRRKAGRRNAGRRSAGRRNAGPGAPAAEGAWIVDRETLGEAAPGGSSAQAGLFAWNGLRLPGEKARQPAIELSGRRRTSQRADAAADAYRGVLDRLASGLLEDAVDGLRELEREVEAHKDPKRAWGWLADAQDRVIRELAEDDPESLLPLLVLHMESHDRTLREGRIYSFRSTSTRRRIVDLATTYGDKAQTDLAPALAAVAQGDLGASYVRGRWFGIARPILESALALDDDNVAALCYLAFVDEGSGRYQDSVDALRRALAVVPRSQEGRLRLALSLRRSAAATKRNGFCSASSTRSPRPGS